MKNPCLFFFLLFVFFRSNVNCFNSSSLHYTFNFTVMNNSPKELVDEVFFFSLNTSRLIQEGKLKPTCEDLMIYLNETVLDYWLETPCNRENTKIWTSIPVLLPNSNIMFFVFYGEINSSLTDNNFNSNITWEGSFFLLSDTSDCFAGWDKENMFDDKYILISSLPFGSNYGNSEHFHTREEVILTNNYEYITTTQNNSKISSSGVYVSKNGHNHQILMNFEEIKNEPPFIEMVLCSSSFLEIPQNSILFFGSSFVDINEDFSFLSNSMNLFLKGSNISRVGRGNNNIHSHNFDGVSLSTNYTTDLVGSTGLIFYANVSEENHVHSVIEDTSIENIEPPFINFLFMKTNGENVPLFDKDVYFIVDYQPPFGYVDVSEEPEFNGYLVRGGNESTCLLNGGIESHSHTIDLDFSSFSNERITVDDIEPLIVENVTISSEKNSSVSVHNHEVQKKNGESIIITSTVDNEESFPPSISVKLVKLKSTSHLTIIPGIEIDLLFEEDQPFVDDDDVEAILLYTLVPIFSGLFCCFLLIFCLLCCIGCAKRMKLSQHNKEDFEMDDQVIDGGVFKKTDEDNEENAGDESDFDVKSDTDTSEKSSEDDSFKRSSSTDSIEIPSLMENKLEVYSLSKIKNIVPIYKSAKYNLFKGRIPSPDPIVKNTYNVMIRDFNVFSKNVLMTFIRNLQIVLPIFHYNLVKIYGYSDLPHVSIITEYCHNVNYVNYVKKKRKRLNFKKKLKILIEITQGIQQYHTNKISHGDISSENVFLKKNLTAKLYPSLPKNATQIDMYDSPYTAPEVIRPPSLRSIKISAFKKSVLKRVIIFFILNFQDSFSLGILMFEIATDNFNPYNIDFSKPRKKLATLVQKNPDYRPELTSKKIEKKKIPEWFIVLMKKCWDNSASKRPGVDAILETLEKNMETSVL